VQIIFTLFIFSNFHGVNIGIILNHIINHCINIDKILIYSNFDNNIKIMIINAYFCSQI